MCHMGLGKTNAITLNVPISFSYPQLYVLSMASCCMEDPFYQSRVSCPTSQLFLYLQPHWWGGMRSRGLEAVQALLRNV